MSRWLKNNGFYRYVLLCTYSMEVSTKSWTDEKLIDAIKAGGARREAAWKFVYEHYQTGLRSKLVKVGGKKEDLEDLLGIVFSDVDRAAGKTDFKLHSGSFFNYLWHAIRNRWVTERQRQKSKSDEISPTLPALTNNPETMHVQKEVLGKVEAMGEPCRTMLLMKGEGYEDLEIANKFGFALQTAKNKMTECRKRLINLIGGKDLYEV